MLRRVSAAKANVIINEFSSNSNPEWVELYNSGTGMINLTGWSLKDGSHPPEPLSGTIAPNGYFVFEKTAGWLNNSGGDAISLLDNASPSAQMVDHIDYGGGQVIGTPQDDHSSGRSPDGSLTWVTNLDITKGGPNPAIAPSATLTPTAPSPIPTAAITPTPIPSITPLKTPTKIPSPSLSEQDNRVLGISNEASPTLSAVPSNSSPAKPRKSIFEPVVFIAPGLVFLGVSAVWAIKDFYSRRQGIIK